MPSRSRPASPAAPSSPPPAGQQAHGRVAPGDSLVVAKLDRFSRNLFDCLGIAQEFQKRGVNLFLLDVGANDPVTGNGQSKLFLSMLGAFAEFERDRISERIKATKQRQKQRGEFSGGVAPFGCRYDEAKRLVPVPDQQKHVRRVRKLAAEGLSPYKISADLAERGVKLSHVSVRKVLRRAA